MSKVVSVLLALIAGIALGGAAILITFGVETGIGLVAGLSAGMCETLKAAQDLNLLTEAQAAQVFERAAENMKAASDRDVTSLVGSVGDCDAALAQLQDGTRG